MLASGCALPSASPPSWEAFVTGVSLPGALSRLPVLQPAKRNKVLEGVLISTEVWLLASAFSSLIIPKRPTW